MNTHKLEKHIELLKSGDNSAFDYIYEQTNRAVYFAVLYIVRDKMYAEDILQDTYLRAIPAWSSTPRAQVLSAGCAV